MTSQDYTNYGMENYGFKNIGKWNNGIGNIGLGNSGKHNIGSWNDGEGNTGDDNTGNHNLGSHNAGDRNIGDWNMTNEVMGCFCIEEADTDTRFCFFDSPCYLTYPEWKASDACRVLDRHFRSKVLYDHGVLSKDDLLEVSEENTDEWGKLSEKELCYLLRIPGLLKNTRQFSRILGKPENMVRKDLLKVRKQSVFD